MSISPLNNYVLVGLAAKRLQWVFAPKQMVAQIFKLNTIGAGEDSMEVSEDSLLEASFRFAHDIVVVRFVIADSLGMYFVKHYV